MNTAPAEPSAWGVHLSEAGPFTPADLNQFRDLLDSDDGFIRELGR